MNCSLVVFEAWSDINLSKAEFKTYCQLRFGLLFHMIIWVIYPSKEKLDLSMTTSVTLNNSWSTRVFLQVEKKSRFSIVGSRSIFAIDVQIQRPLDLTMNMPLEEIYEHHNGPRLQGIVRESIPPEIIKFWQGQKWMAAEREGYISTAMSHIIHIISARSYSGLKEPMKEIVMNLLL